MEQEVKLEKFFRFDLKEPINRLAYTEEDMEYKIKIIKEMQKLGMEITVDKVGNICGTISLGNNPQVVLAMGSHTDSVYDGGQYDGPVGVIVGLQTLEELLKSKKCNGIVKVVIYACEESSRFGNACIGSKFLSGKITEEQFEKIVDQKALEKKKIITLKQAIEKANTYLKERVEGIKEVEKVFEEVDYSLEAHIEQYELLQKQYEKNKSQEIIGIVNTVGSAVRVKYDVKGEAGHSGSTPMKKRRNAVDATAMIGKKVRKLGKQYEKQGLGRASQVEINTPGHNGSFNQIPKSAQGLIDFRLLGENTPEKVLEDFGQIVKKVEKKTKTNIIPSIVSKGIPVITSQSLNLNLATICEQNNMQYIEMPSYAGQDTGYIPAKEKTMIFIPSTGGSHKPEEATEKQFIETATKVFTELSKNLLLERFRDSQVVHTQSYEASARQMNTKREEIEQEAEQNR